MVVAEGEAVGAQLAGFESPVAGAQEQETPPEPVSGVDAPAQISAVPDAAALGRGLTVTSALPEPPAEQWASETDVTV